MEKQINAYKARRNFGRVLEEAYYNKDAFVVTRSGREMAVIVSVDDYRKWQQLAKERASQMVKEVQGKNKDVPVAELEADVEKAVKMLRDEKQQASA